MSTRWPSKDDLQAEAVAVADGGAPPDDGGCLHLPLLPRLMHMQVSFLKLPSSRHFFVYPKSCQNKTWRILAFKADYISSTCVTVMNSTYHCFKMKRKNIVIKDSPQSSIWRKIQITSRRVCCIPASRHTLFPNIA